MRERMKVVTVKIKSGLLDELDAYAIKNQMSRSEAAREAIRLLLQSEHKKETIPDDRYKYGEPRVLTLKIEDELLKELDSYAANNKMNRSEVIRKAILLLIQKEREKETVPKAKVEKFKLI